MAFLFTVLGEWYVENKVISRGEMPRISRNFSAIWKKTPDCQLMIVLEANDKMVDTSIGMAFSLVGIALCVISKQ